MKTVALIASCGRGEILPDVLSCVLPQVDDCVLVGTSIASKDEYLIAMQNNIAYWDAPNSPLGAKWAAGLNLCRKMDADAVLICGSDDLLSSYWVQESHDLHESRGCLLTGANTWYMYNCLTDETVSVKYKDRNDPVGAGRIIYSRALDACDWNIFPTEPIGCDFYSYNTLKYFLNDSEIGDITISDMLSIKGPWRMLDTWQQIYSSPNVECTTVDYQKEIIFSNINFEKYRRMYYVC